MPGPRSTRTPPRQAEGSYAAPWWLWQVPTALFTTACALLLVATDRRVPVVVAAALAVALVVGVCVVGATGPADRRAGVLLPVTDLVAAALVHGAAGPTTWSTILLCGLPVAWLAFAFGAVGAVVGCVSVVVVAVAPFVAGSDLPSTSTGWADAVVPALGLLVMAVVTYGASRGLRAARTELTARTDALELQVLTTAAVLEAVDAAVWVFVPGRDVVRNDAAARLADRSRSAGGDQVFGPDRRTPVPRHEQAHVRAVQGESFQGLLHWVGRPEDQVAVVCAAHQMRDDSGAERGSVLSAWDATAVLDSMRVREEFLSTVSHELRTPLTSIMGHLELLEDHLADGPLDPTTGRRHLSVARRNALTLTDRVEQLLTAGDGTDTGSVRPVVIDVAALVRATVDRHRAGAARARLGLDVVGPATLLGCVDPIALDRVLENLLTNALKYSERGRVVVDLAARPDRPARPDRAAELDDGPTGFVLSVSDSGAGLQEHEARHVFERFYRAEAATRGVVPGIGIGLAVVKQLVESHGGTVSVRSRPGVGTTFVVTMP
ncbi:MAG: putative integral rane two-component sensor kinase [Nocardioides sp.]|nr:putative integral rane two-component sensor kinase [Nocardioides sp.]